MQLVTLFAALRLGLTLSLAAPLAAAQSFNIDVGDDPGLGVFGVPAPTFGAAAAQPGFWNGMTDGAVGVGLPPATSVPWYVATLSDLAGTPTTVTTSVTVNSTSNGLGDFEFDNPATTGNDQALMDDCEDVGGTASTATWTISGLQSGSYQVFVYAWAPDSSTFLTRVNLGGVQQTSGGVWPGGYVLGTTHTLHSTLVTGGTITIAFTTVSGFGSCNGIQLVREATSPTTPFCFGDGAGTACPCGPGAPGNGCPNSVVAGGARLVATGNASVTGDTFRLDGSGMPLTVSCLYFQGTSQVNGGLGIVFGDGLRCAGGTVIRLGTKTNVGGASFYPAAGDQPISLRGMIPATGGLHHYQGWYRNAAVFCTSATFNLTNGISVAWVP